MVFRRDIDNDDGGYRAVFTFSNMVDLCHLINVELGKHLQKYEGASRAREDTVKDEEGQGAVFAAQGSSVTQMQRYDWRNRDVVTLTGTCVSYRLFPVTFSTTTEKLAQNALNKPVLGANVVEMEIINMIIQFFAINLFE